MIAPTPPELAAPIRRLDLRAAGVGSVICATGYTMDFGWIDARVLDTRGMPVHQGGAPSVPGLYFIGLPWLS